MTVMTEVEFKKIHPFGSYLGYLCIQREKATPLVVPAFDEASFVRCAQENEARGYCND